MFSRACGRARFGKDRAELTSFFQKPCAIVFFPPASVVGHVKPQFGLVGLLEHDAQTGGKFGVRSGAARNSGSCPRRQPGLGQLACKSAGSCSVRKRLGKLENLHCEAFRSSFQIFSCLVHAPPRCIGRSSGQTEGLLSLSTFGLSRVALSAILQFCNPAISALPLP
jgi:hypothetical protein